MEEFFVHQSKFLKNEETDQKYKEIDLKFGTNQQIEILKSFDSNGTSLKDLSSASSGPLELRDITH